MSTRFVLIIAAASLLFALLLPTATPALASVTSVTIERYAQARSFLESGNITRFLNVAFNFAEPLPTYLSQPTPPGPDNKKNTNLRRAATGRLVGCVQSDRLHALSQSMTWPFSPSSSGGAAGSSSPPPPPPIMTGRPVINVSSCLSHCAAIRVLDNWANSALANPLARAMTVSSDVIGAVDTELVKTTTQPAQSNCWCMPQNMSSFDDIKLWHAATFGGEEVLPPSCCWMEQPPPVAMMAGALAEDQEEDEDDYYYMSPRPQRHRSARSQETTAEIIHPDSLPLGADSVISYYASSSPQAKCPLSKAEIQSTQFTAIFSADFTCGLAGSACSAGCVQHPAFVTPVGRIDDVLRPCVPVSYALRAPEQIFDPLTISLIVTGSLFVLMWCFKCVVAYRKMQENEARREALLTRSSGSGNVAGLMSGAGAAAAASGNSGSSGDPNNNRNSQQQQDLARELLHRLPTNALNLRSVEQSRSIAHKVLSHLVTATPNPAVTAAIQRAKKNSAGGSSSKNNTHLEFTTCSVCLESINTPVEVVDEALTTFPPVTRLPNCGHAFHTLCLHRQLVYEAQRQRDTKPTCAVCRVQLASEAPPRRIVTSNPLE